MTEKEGKLITKIRRQSYHCFDMETKEQYEKVDKETGGNGVLHDISASVDLDDAKTILDEAAKEYPRYEDYRKFSNSNSHTHGCPIHDWNADPNQNHCSCPPKRGRDYEKDREQWFKKWFGEHP